MSGDWLVDLRNDGALTVCSILGESTEEQPSDAEEEPYLAVARSQSLRKASLASNGAHTNANTNTQKTSSNQLKNSNDSSFNYSYSSAVMPNHNSDDSSVEQNEKAQTSGTGPYSDLGRLMQIQQQQQGGTSGQQQQQLYNYLLYSNLLNNVKM